MKLSFTVTRGLYGTYSSLNWLVLNADGVAAASSAMTDISDVTTYEIAGAPRGTIDVVLNQVGDDPPLTLIRDPESTVPTGDTSDDSNGDPAGVLFFDASDRPVSLLPAPVVEPGYVGWEIDPADGIVDLTDTADVVLEVVAGSNVTVDDGDPQRPVVSAEFPVSGRPIQPVDGVCDIGTAYAEEPHPFWFAVPGSGGDPVEIELPDPADSEVLFVTVSSIPPTTPVGDLNGYSFTCAAADGGVNVIGVGNDTLTAVPYICCPLQLPGVFKAWFVFPFYVFDTAP